MRIILIGNYPPDSQESMERFAQMLQSGFHEAGFESEIWRPQVFFGALAKSTSSGFGKWLGYLDKMIFFPIILRFRIQSSPLRSTNVRFHVCDHSNAFYLQHLPIDRTAITCHDVIAVRGGLGYADAHLSTSKFGKFLQQWILYCLSRARLLATDSQLTFNQLRELVPNKANDQKNWQVIHIAFNANFKPLNIVEAHGLLRKKGIDSKRPFILHVGSGLFRKNRRMLLDMADALGNKWSGQICFAGDAIDANLKIHAESLGLQERIVSVVRPDHATLVALYTVCDAFIFPSLSEGFGWPLIEAQACGSPVIASNIEPMPEVSGGAALHADPNKPQDFAQAFLSLRDDAVRRKLIEGGFNNVHRFSLEQMTKAYIDLHSIKPV